MSKNSTCFPFYVNSMDHKRSEQIIKEAKAEIKKLESHRPRTPFIGRVQVGYQNNPLSRPSSCTSLKSLNYEPEEHASVFCRKISNTKTKIGDGDIKLQPIVTKTVLKSRKFSSSFKVLGKAAFTGFPPLPCEDNYKCNAKKCCDESHDEGTGKEILRENVHSLKKSNLDVQNDLADHELLQSLSIKSETSHVDNKKPFNLNEKFEVDNISKDLQDFFPLLERFINIGRKVKEEDVIKVVKKIHRLLEEKYGFLLIHESRTRLLKLLFKLLDSHFPVLSLNIVKLLFQAKIKDKNLTNSFRLVFKLMKDEKVDLNEYQIIESIFETMSNISASSNSEVALYGVRILKALLCSSNKLEMQQREKCMTVLIFQLKELNLMLPKQAWDSNCMEVIALIVSSFRYLIENDLLWNYLVKVETLTEILNILISCSQSTEMVDTVVRLISKIMDKEDGCVALSQCPQNLLLSLLSLSKTYLYHIDLTLQITFIIGKLMSFDEKTALAFVTSPNFSNTLIVIDEYINEHLKFKGTVSDCFKINSLVTCGDRNWSQDIFQVILKVLSIWANICLHSESGLCLAKHEEVVSNLLAIIVAYTDTESLDKSVALRSFLVVIGNISYYLESDCELSIKVTESVVPLLDDSFSNEVRFEAANVIRNLTRISHVRSYIHEHALISAFINLLSEDNKEFCMGAYGIIMNLLIDDNTRGIFYKEQGVTRILHKLHLCSDRDWKSSAFLCQILWNYFGGENAEFLSVSEMEAQHLIKYLSYSTRNDAVKEFVKKDTNFYHEWENLFCPVAQKLLELLRTKHVTLC